ncbi:BON domain-containing protein [bacterium]|nr:BON domain-containing protein [bacterium]
MFNIFDKTDSQIQQDVVNEIKWDPSVTSAQVIVTAKNGIVTLRGNVAHYFEKTHAEEAAQRIGGVRAVVDEMEVGLMGSFTRSDEQIAEAALNALSWNYLAAKNVKVVVEKGWITLTGDAEWEYQRKAAKHAVSQLMGVIGVTDHIAIKSKVIPADVKKSIEDALKRSAEVEGRKISVTVNGDRAILSGNVHSVAERIDAGHAAWMAPGIMTVENNLKIAH